MAFIDVKCKNCCANLKVNSDSPMTTCEYCNTTFRTEELIPNFNNQNNFAQDNNNNNYNNNYNRQEPPRENMNNGYNVPNNTNMGNKKKKKKKKNKVKIILYIFFCALIIGSAIVWYIDYRNGKETPPEPMYEVLPSEIETKETIPTQADSTTIKLAPDVDLNYERSYYNNPDIIARLEIPDLFNVLVTKGSDNSFYLSHSVKKDYDIRGTEFMDYRNNVYDKQINIYGHNTRDVNIKVSFLKLEKYLDPTFFNDNPYIVLQYDGGKNLYKVLAMKEILSNNPEHMILDKTGVYFKEHVRNMSTGEGVINSRNDLYYDENSEIIVLQTCSHHWDDAFYTVVAVKIADL